MKYLFILLISIPILAKPTLLESIKELDSKIFKVENFLEETKKSITSIQKNIQKNEINLSNLQEKKISLKKQINKRLKYLFKVYNVGKNISFFSSSKDVLEIEQKEKFIKIINKQDLELLNNFHKIIKEENKTINDNMKNLLVLEQKEKDLVRQKKLLQKERIYKRKKLKKILLSIKLREQLKKEREKQEKSLTVKEKVSKNTNFMSMKGKFDFPVNAKVSKWYFVKKNKRSFILNKGLTFFVSIGTKVKTIYDGRVVFCNYIKGFGKTIIVSHGNSYYSLYMHLNKILVEKNQSIKRNDLIALSGESGSAERAKLYFEIRKKKNPININRWFKIKN